MAILLERDGELAALEQAVRAAIAGRGGLVLVGGEAGIGKTALVRELRGRTSEAVSFLSGACEPLSVPVPLGPLREIAEAAGAPDPVELGTGDRLALARALAVALDSRAPAVAVVEDVHWADPATLDVVRLLARRLEERGVVLLLTFREDEVAANPDLTRLVGDLAAHPLARRLGLRPLSRPAIAELASQSGVDPGRVAEVTGGNPFLVVEVLSSADRLPRSVRDATLARVSRLGAEARETVECAAVLGGRVDPGVLRALAPDSEAAVEEALARGVLRAEGSLLGFRHELIRDAVEDLIAPDRRAELHLRALTALLESRGSPDNARLAHHAERAGARSRACSYAVLAAADAERAGALREVRLQAERALRLGTGLGPEQRLSLLIQHARAANFTSNRLSDSAESAEQAVALARELGDGVSEGRALVALAWALWSMDRVVEAKAAAEEAVAVLEPAGDVAELARAQATAVRMEATAFDPQAAGERGAAALATAQGAGLQEVCIDLAISLGLARGHRGEAGALEQLAEAREAARRAELPIQTVRAHVNTTFVAVQLRRHELVDAIVPDALAACDELGAQIPANAIEIHRARSLLDRGRWEEARMIAARPGRNLAAEAPVALAIEAAARARRGEAGAAELLAEAWRQLEPVPESSRHGMVRSVRIEVAWLQGDADQARRLVQTALHSQHAARFARTAGELAVWARRLGLAAPAPPGAPEPALRDLEGDWRAAVRGWKQAQAPYEAALAALPGDGGAARDALATLHRLEAPAAARAFSRARGEAGAPAPRGPRRSTLANPAGLTRRQQEVLERLATGSRNAEIADALHLSERTVDHHVSAILDKLGAATRLAAVEQARARGLLPQDGQPPSRT